MPADVSSCESRFYRVLLCLLALPLLAPLSAAAPIAASPGENPSAGSPAQGVWTTRAPAPTKRTEVAAAAVNGKIYVVGGFSEPSLSNLTNLAITNAVEEYDPAANTWAARASLPVGLHHTGIATLGGRIYVAGGFTKSLLSVWSPVATLYRFDPEGNTWTTLAPMPTARGALAMTEIGGQLLAIGGYTETGNSAAVERYDPTTNTWTAAAPLPTARDHLAVVTVSGRVYAIGGRLNRDYSRNLAVTEIYDPGSNSWSKGIDLPTARSGITASVLRGTIYVLGGEAPEGTFQTNEAYLPTRNAWQTMAPMPTGRHGLGSAVIGNHLYTLSGGPKPGGSFSNVNERFSPPGMSTEGRPRASLQQVGTVMALLAAFQDAGALPPEGTPEANQLVKALIQFQAAFMRSTNEAVQRLLQRALTETLGAQATAAEETFKHEGWDSRSLEAIVEYVASHPVWDEPELAGLQEGFSAYNIGRADLDRLAQTLRLARTQLASQGQDLHSVYATRRRQMPGS
jgi:N-acetylneuraminic acid mutarotase